jgi:23S rRNA (pseudouridine1915-N3)-methyltransferase
MLVEKKMNQGCRELTFVIGGPYGFSPKAAELDTEKISLSRMTFSHQMARLLLAEQLYRAFTIIRGESYHHD